jgi:hypothetical protein
MVPMTRLYTTMPTFSTVSPARIFPADHRAGGGGGAQRERERERERDRDRETEIDRDRQTHVSFDI